MQGRFDYLASSLKSISSKMIRKKTIRASARSCGQVRLHGILASRHPLDTGIVEGIENAIKAIGRRVYGCRDLEYFFLKICAAFCGNVR